MRVSVGLHIHIHLVGRWPQAIRSLWLCGIHHHRHCHHCTLSGLTCLSVASALLASPTTRAVPSFVIVATALCMVVYVGFNFLANPPPTSFNTIFDEYSRERTMFDPAKANATGEEKEVERPIEPISDISIDQINSLMFGDPQKRAQQF